jgi:hypothetical protein
MDPFFVPLYRFRVPGHSEWLSSCRDERVGPRRGRRALLEAFDQPLGVVPNELADDPARLGDARESMEINCSAPSACA